MKLFVRLMFGALALTVGAANARANGTLDEALRGIAADVKKLLGENEDSIAIGQFRGTGEIGNLASAGPNIVHELTRHMKSVKLNVVVRGKYILQGDYGEIEDIKTEKQAIELKWEIIESKTRKQVVGNQHKFVKNEAAIAILLGLTVSMKPDEPPQQRNKDIKKQIDKPETQYADPPTNPGGEKTLIKAAKDSRFGIEFLVAPPDPAKEGKRTTADYSPRVAKDEGGLAFVPIRRDEVYAVRLYNDADHEVAVDLRIDGLSMFVFSSAKDPKTGLPAYRYIVIPKKSSVTIRGWHVSNDDSDEFLVTSYAKSAAAELKSNSANVGTVTACFHAAWPKNGTPPADEPKNPNEFSQSADATGRGKRFQMKYEVVEYKVGVLRDVISVRYSK